MTEQQPEHRWSGWPRAWCLDCGAEDQREVCLAGDCGVHHVWFAQDEEGPMLKPPICPNKPCAEPGSERFDPYAVAQLRALFAAAAMAGLLAHGTDETETWSEVAETAYNIADAMLEERKLSR